MLLWLALLTGVVCVAAFVGLAVSMRRAERRARRLLYQSLGLSAPTVEFLMTRKQDVHAELAYVRRNGDAAFDAQEPPARRRRFVVFQGRSEAAGRRSANEP